MASDRYGIKGTFTFPAETGSHSSDSTHCSVPARYQEDGYRLGKWVSHQRNRKSTLAPERLERLEAIGFVWGPITEAWEEGFSKLQKFKIREGHCDVPARYQEDGYSLGRWVTTQRKTESTLSPKRLERLEAIGFVWDPFADGTGAGCACARLWKTHLHCQ